MTTGNPERDKRIKRAIAECAMLHEPPNFGLVVQKLPADFDLSDAELSDALGIMKHDAAIETAAPAPAPEPESKPSEITREQSLAAMHAAQTWLGEARIAVRVAQDKMTDTRAALAKNITGWQTQTDNLTPAQRQQRVTREFLASEQANRAARGAPSSKATAFAQKRMVNGPQRGAFSMQQAARVGFKVGK